MIQQAESYGRSYSASTELWLQRDDRRIQLSQIGPGFVSAMEDSDDLPKGVELDLHATIDDHEVVWRVRLPEGMTSGRGDTKIVVLDRQ